MKSVWTRTICRLLVALMIWTPYYIAQAGMIGTGEAASTAAQANSSADRTTVLNFLSRSDVAARLQSLGIDPSTAHSRVAALSDQEVSALAQRIDAMPAGGDDWGWVLLVIVVAAAVWWFFFRK
jgi:hypothetical protein